MYRGSPSLPTVLLVRRGFCLVYDNVFKDLIFGVFYIQYNKGILTGVINENE